MRFFLLASLVRKTSHELNNHFQDPCRNVLLSQPFLYEKKEKKTRRPGIEPGPTNYEPQSRTLHHAALYVERYFVSSTYAAS